MVWDLHDLPTPTIADRDEGDSRNLPTSLHADGRRSVS
jgi:hypothetical protein